MEPVLGRKNNVESTFEVKCNKFRQPEGKSKGQATEIFVEVEEVVRLRRAIGRLYSDFTGQSLTQIAEDLDRDVFLNAKQACKYGLIDLIRKSTKT